MWAMLQLEIICDILLGLLWKLQLVQDRAMCLLIALPVQAHVWPVLPACTGFRLSTGSISGYWHYSSKPDMIRDQHI